MPVEIDVIKDLEAKEKEIDEVVANINAYNTKKSLWQKLVDYLAICSEASNTGIVIHMASNFFPVVARVGGGILSTIASYADPAIYFFKDLIQFVQGFGETIFNVKFDDAFHGKHKLRTPFRLLSMGLFSVAIALFCGAIISSPIGITVACALALTSMKIIGYFDYYDQTKRAEKNWRTCCFLKGENHPDSKLLRKDFLARRKSMRLFMALLVGLTVLLVGGSAAVFAPPLIAPILLYAAKAASAYLGCIAVARLCNYLASTRPGQFISNLFKSNKAVDPDADCDLQVEMTEISQMNTRNIKLAMDNQSGNDSDHNHLFVQPDEPENDEQAPMINKSQLFRPEPPLPARPAAVTYNENSKLFYKTTSAT